MAPKKGKKISKNSSKKLQLDSAKSDLKNPKSKSQQQQPSKTKQPTESGKNEKDKDKEDKDRKKKEKDHEKDNSKKSLKKRREKMTLNRLTPTEREALRTQSLWNKRWGCMLCCVHTLLVLIYFADFVLMAIRNHELDFIINAKKTSAKYG
ncbi:hypothetical protein WR25_00316 [Diploscapter pachys]|uniref:Uncharacterized protein n=1 Tax=Diploscapter pachys TaxID=2018661 RepID=A0A2A2L0H0_9BILA|nr:hypothetical protein WR25_00316 [Diploscapter pachys]